MRITPHARPQLHWCALATALWMGAFAALAWRGACPYWLFAALPALLFFGWALWFFRDPPRTIPDAPGLIVAPADGVVTHVDRVDSLSVEADGQTPAAHAFLSGPAQRVSIFLSVFNVHLNRAPLAGRVAFREYRRGAFFDARREESHGKNERLDLGIVADDQDAPRCVVRQLSGLIARRIVCAAEPGDALARGDVYGMIKFGSRTSLFVPEDARIEWRVKPGDRVKAGETVLGEIRRGS